MTEQSLSVYDGRLLVFLPEKFVVMTKAGVRCFLNPEFCMSYGRLIVKRLTIDTFHDDRMTVDSNVLRDVKPGPLLAEWAVKHAAFMPDGSRYQLPAQLGGAASVNSDAELERFSQAYAYLMATGQNPTGVLLSRYGIARPTTCRRAALARENGFLKAKHEHLYSRSRALTRDLLPRDLLPH